MLRLATFNVKDLLEPPINDRSRFERKVDWLAKMFERTQADVIALQEVGPLDLLERVLSKMPLPFPHVHLGSPDDRGIRCAVVSRFAFLDAENSGSDDLPFPTHKIGPKPPFSGPLRMRRSVVRVAVQTPTVSRLDFVTAHFKSRRPVWLTDVPTSPDSTSARELAEARARSVAWRAAEALLVRTVVDALWDAGHRFIAVAGDFNDTSPSVPLEILRGEGERALLDVTLRVESSRRFTSRHDGRREQIDHFLGSPMLDGMCTSVEILNEQVREHPFVPSDEQLSRGVSRPRLQIDSDHAPIVVTLSG